jgi:hypothetical protein
MYRQLRVPAGGQLTGKRSQEQLAFLLELLLVGFELPLPLLLQLGAALAGLAQVLTHLGGHHKRLVWIPAKIFLGFAQVLVA